MAERPIIVFGKWRGNPSGTIAISGFSGEDRYRKKINVDNFKPRKSNLALRYLWARHKIKILSDYSGLRDVDYKDQVLELGLKYNLLTKYTSFVAIDSEIRNQDGDQTTVKQPLPLPQGVSDYAVGGNTMSYRKRTSLRSDATFETAAKPAYPTKGKRKIGSANIKIDRMTVIGAIEKAEIRKFIENNFSNISYCISQIADSDGKIVIRFIIEKSGDINEVEIRFSSLGKTFENCIENRFKRLKFPERNRKSTTCTVTLELKK
jgi:Ca-activated chloride channel family protein